MKQPFFRKPLIWALATTLLLMVISSLVLVKARHDKQDIPQYSISGGLPAGSTWDRSKTTFGPYLFISGGQTSQRMTIGVFPPIENPHAFDLNPIFKKDVFLGQKVIWYMLPRGNTPSYPMIGTAFDFRLRPESKPVSISVTIHAKDDEELKTLFGSIHSLTISELKMKPQTSSSP